MRPLVPEWVESLKPYVPGKPIEETEREYNITNVIKLASNENPLGPAPLAVEAMEVAARKVHLYPDGSSYYLVRRLAQHLGVEANEVFVGSGSNEIIELIIRTFTTPDDETLLSAGSFMMYKVALQSHGRRFVEVPMQAGFRYDLPAMARALTPKVRLVFLANPDNPTGTAFSRAELEAFLAHVGPETFVVLDEAYFEYVDWAEYPNGLDYFRKHPNLFVLRTYSKIYGLAGIRLGYGVMNPRLVGYLNRTKMPFNLTSVAQAAGLAALDDVEHLRTTRETTHRGLRYLERELRALGIDVPHSHANFVFANFKGPAQPIYEKLLPKGVIVRPVPGSGWPNALRISAGLQSQNERLVKALTEILKG
ncbi:MAG: histidinol-phosphate transaminase [Archangiaceae bacterium]|nr:histidinol-phosphate transaminase [Archangiaceae bacterium]